jgi:hypothetical protein
LDISLPDANEQYLCDRIRREGFAGEPVSSLLLVTRLFGSLDMSDEFIRIKANASFLVRQKPL